MKYLFLFVQIFLSFVVKAQYTWRELLPDKIDNIQYNYTSLTCTENGNCFLVGNTFDIKAVRYQQFFMYSMDRGTTWDSVRIGPSKISLPFLRKIHAADSLHIYATGDSGYFTKSNDGGKTWAQLRRIQGVNDYQDMYFTDSSNGIIVGQYGHILTTADGGDTWKLTATQQGWIITSCTGFSGGKYLAFDKYSGKVYRSSDFGNSWDTVIAYNPYVNGDFQLFMYDSYFHDSQSGYLFGLRQIDNSLYLPLIMRTTNGGEKWDTIIDTSTENVLDVFSMCFLTPERGITIGRDRKYLLTNDSGVTWMTDSVDLPFIDWSFIDNLVKVTDEKVLAIAGDKVMNYVIVGVPKTAGVIRKEVTIRERVIYPNPVYAKLFFDGELLVTEGAIYDFLGRKVKELSLAEVAKCEVDCAELPSGIYWLKINNTGCYKFIKL